MRLDPMLLAILSALAVLGFAAYAIWRHADSERQRWTRYNRPRSEGPKSWVCPTCLTRYHGERAIREQHCRACDKGASKG